METNVTNAGATWNAPEYYPQSSFANSWQQRISWAAVFAGLIIAVFIQLALTLLGVAIGMSTVDAVGGDTPGKGLAIGSGIWYVVTMLISLFAGGWVAGRLAKDKHTSESFIHGLLVAGLLFVLTFYLISSAIGGIIGGAGKMIGGAVSSAAPSVKQAAQERYQPGTATGDDQLAADNAKLKNVVAENKDEALKVADDAAAATGNAALFSFIGILLGAGAAGFGAKKGRDSKVPDNYDQHYNSRKNDSDKPDKHLNVL
ncbi:hypothetical protein GS399_19745 [Pedobacter sp. HMF7647]|uniref:TIGR04086 family membrane protein n=1 Tax=Hufsiella arboris TaxID=2695275 RepID=A0A7K1YF32_9SPHI|nr:TIGR04086 family membrane protein [Hufsiella arboris]MXV53205.1 hypothetical protein [Hufsiella arboris]